MFDTAGRAYHVVERLLDQTRRDKVTWAKANGVGTYETAFTNYRVELSPYFDAYSAVNGNFRDEYLKKIAGELYYLKFFDNGGMMVETIEPPSTLGAVGLVEALRRPDLALTQSLLKNLYDIVSAKFSDSRVFDEILRELDR